MISTKILNETAPLEAVVLGTGESMGGIPTIEETYDPKSKAHVEAGTYPREKDLIEEMGQVAKVFEKYGVVVYRPRIINDYNQIFARDVAFTIGEQLVVPNIIAERSQEVEGVQYIIEQAENVVHPSEEQKIEGGDVMLWTGYLFIGYSKDEDFKRYQVARTNEDGVEFLRENFPNWKIKTFELTKSDENPRENALHLDCCFQPVGDNKAVICPEGFKHQEDVAFLVDKFGEENMFEISRDEMYEMNSNFFSISPEVVISIKGFDRLNQQLRKWGLTVEEVNYTEVAKMGGSLRCSTMPLRRRYE